MILHASAVAIRGRGCLIVGASGSGKTALSVALIALGGTLIADDQTVLRLGESGKVELSAPDRTGGLIEVRHVGLFRLPSVTAPLGLVVDLDRSARARLPAPRFRHLMGAAHPVILGKGREGLPGIVMIALNHAFAHGVYGGTEACT